MLWLTRSTIPNPLPLSLLYSLEGLRVAERMQKDRVSTVTYASEMSAGTRPVQVSRVFKPIGREARYCERHCARRHGEEWGRCQPYEDPAGFYLPDEGEDSYKAGRITLDSPHDALRLGISMIQQGSAFLSGNDGHGNIFIGRTRLPVIRLAEQAPNAS